MTFSKPLRWLLLFGTLGGCATLGGFEDFTPGDAEGGSPAQAGEPAVGGKANAAGGAPGGAGTTVVPAAGEGGEPAGQAGDASQPAGGRGDGGSQSGSGGSTPNGGKGGSGGSAGAGGNGGSAGVGGNGGVAGTGGKGGTGGGGSGGGGSGLLEDCVLLMHFEEPSWSMKSGEVIDSSGYGNHGTASTGSLTTSSSGQGKFGRAAKFDGSGGVRVPDAPSLRAKTVLTLSAWIYPTFISSNGSGIITKRKAFGQQTAYSLFVWINTAPPAQLYTDIQLEDDRFPSLATFEVNSWYHVAVVYDGSLAQAERSRVYVNGKLDKVSSDAASQIEPYTSDLTIGDLVDGGERFVGYIDEAAVWTRALSVGEVAQLHAATGPL
jgi:Concanavalin A-like lectin/glucanases superfamily